MSFPTTETGLKEAGYVYDNTAKCRGCGSEINWYRTPKGKTIPLDPDLRPHWSTCPNAEDFREKAPNPRTGSFSAKNDGYRR